MIWGGIAQLISTRPPTEERVAALRRRLATGPLRAAWRRGRPQLS